MIRQAFRQYSLSRTLLTKHTRCQYHSYEHEKAPSFTPTETSILSAGLALVPELGFTQDALVQGARDVGYRDISTNLFPDGTFALVRYHLATQRLALASKHVDQELGTALQVKELALKRLHANAPIIHQWQDALSLMAVASNIPVSLRELALLSDEILFLAGDSSVDTSWYTKRLALSTAYASSELFMTTDKSPNYGETEAFLSRRLNESNYTGKMLRDTGTWLGVQGIGLINGLRSKGVRI